MRNNKQILKQAIRDILDDAMGGDPPLQDQVEVLYMDRAVASWAHWATVDGSLGFPSILENLVKSTENSKSLYFLAMTDDQFVDIDRAIARLPKRMRAVIEIEYCRAGTIYEKAQRLCVSRRDYRGRVNSVLSTLYGELMPEIERWRKSVE